MNTNIASRTVNIVIAATDGSDSLTIEVTLPVDTNLEDGVRAFLSKLGNDFSEVFSRAEDLFIRSLSVLSQDGIEWSDKQKAQTIASPEFIKRLATALHRGRLPVFNQQELFLLRNWRRLNSFPEGGPGLCEWRTSAAISLMQIGELVDENYSDEAYDKLVSRLRLSESRLPSKIKDCILDRFKNAIRLVLTDL